MARTKTKDHAKDPDAGLPASKSTHTRRQTNAHLDAFDALMASAAVDSQVRALAESGADSTALNAALTTSLQQAQQRWGLGLHHLTHTAEVTEGTKGNQGIVDAEQPDIILLTDGRPTTRISAGSAAIASAYAPMQALDDRGLSLWGALPDGHRVPEGAPFTQLKVLIEDARDFETHWSAARNNSFSRMWRKDDRLFIEIARPASPQAALSDAAWDVITSIKDRTLQRELMRRSEEAGMLGALLAARHAGASANLSRLPEAHFTVQAIVTTLNGPEARSAETYRTALKNAQAELEDHQGHATKMLAEVLKHGLNSR